MRREDAARSFDATTPRMNGEIARMRMSECPYDIEDGWLRNFRHACDRFLISRGIDPHERTVKHFYTGKKKKNLGVDELHTF